MENSPKTGSEKGTKPRYGAIACPPPTPALAPGETPPTLPSLPGEVEITVEEKDGASAVVRVPWKEQTIRLPLPSGKVIDILIEDRYGKTVYADPLEQAQVGTGLNVFIGDVSLTTSFAKIGDGLRAAAREVLAPLPKRPAHPDGYTCDQCRHWDGKAGKGLLTEVTHQYCNGVFNDLAEEIKAIATKRGLPMLTKDNAGYCDIEDGLVARTAPACVGHFLLDPAWEAVRAARGGA